MLSAKQRNFHLVPVLGNRVVLRPGLASHNIVMSKCFGTCFSKVVIALQKELCDLTGRISELLVQLKSFFLSWLSLMNSMTSWIALSPHDA